MRDILLIGMPGGGEIFVILFVVFCLILPFVAIIDIASNKSMDGSNKLLWVVIVVFAPLIGSVIYFLIGKKKAEKKESKPESDN